VQLLELGRRASSLSAASLGFNLASVLSGCLPSGGPSARSLQPAIEGALPSLVPSQTALSAALLGQAQPLTSAFPLSGIWTGTAKSETHELGVRINLHAHCQVGETCGTFVLTIPCAGALTFVGQEGDIYEFRSDDKTGLCSADGRDFLQLLPGGRLGYDSRSDYGQAIGILSPVRFQAPADPHID
jgi:hypothetical protein